MPVLPERLRSLSAALHSPRWSQDKLRAFQTRQLRKLVRHAREQVPLYRNLYERHGIHPDDIRGLEDLGRLAIVERLDIQVLPPSEVVARGWASRRLVIRRTGGSSGAPLEIRRTWFEERLLHGFRLREFRKLGLRLTDLRVSVTSGNTPQSGHRFDNRYLARFGLLRRPYVSCLLPPREILDRLAELQPDVLGGYSGTLSWIAGEATDAHRRAIRPRFIVAGAETLTPEMRRQITGCFSAPVYEIYGAHEFNLVAVECPESGLFHASEHCTIAEVIKDGKPVAPGETGELVGTALHSFAMPFIRYRLGDLVTRGPIRCPCGAPGLTFERVVGRVLDCFPLPDGSEIHPYNLTRPLARRAPWLRRFQMIQTDLRHIDVKLIPLPGQHPARDALDGIRAEMEKVVGPDVTVALEFVEELPPAANGKYRPCYSMVVDRK